MPNKIAATAVIRVESIARPAAGAAVVKVLFMLPIE